MAFDVRNTFGIDPERIFIAGSFVESSGTDRREIRNPANGELVATVAAGCAEDVDRAVAAAKAAFPAWRETTPMQRAELLTRFVELADRHLEDIATLVTLESGKMIADSRADIRGMNAFVRYAAEAARHLEGEILPGDNRQEQLWLQRVPFGVVGAITAWNFPPALFGRKLGPALVTGNTIVLKPHELTPINHLVLAELTHRAGFPDGVINVVVGDGREVGARMVEHPDVAMVSMTGSSRAGVEILSTSSPRMKPVRLECGGKAPALVMEDCDLDRAVESLMIAKYWVAGCACTASDRLLIHERIYDAFVEKYLARVAALTVGDPFGDSDVGPRISSDEVRKLEAISRTALAQDATLLTSPYREERNPLFSKGNWFFPQLFEVKSHDIDIMRDEIFGPIGTVMKVSGFDEALHYANKSDYGLSAYVYTRSNKRIMRCINELEFGEIFINRQSGESVHGFHHGWKMSGMGGEDGKHGIEGYLRKKIMYNNFSYTE